VFFKEDVKKKRHITFRKYDRVTLLAQ